MEKILNLPRLNLDSKLTVNLGKRENQNYKNLTLGKVRIAKYHWNKVLNLFRLNLDCKFTLAYKEMEKIPTFLG